VLIASSGHPRTAKRWIVGWMSISASQQGRYFLPLISGIALRLGRVRRLATFPVALRCGSRFLLGCESLAVRIRLCRLASTAVFAALNRPGIPGGSWV
jgi:hypothetical protein